MSRPLALIADDDTASRVLLGRVLERYGFDIRLSADGEALVADAAAWPAAVVVTDEQMPRCGGVDAIGRLRRAGLMLPAVVVSAFPEPELALRVAALGSCVLLPKPLDLARLREVLAPLLDGPRPAV